MASIRAIKTSGATGTEALHVYGWEAFVTFVMQGSRWTGRRGEAPDAVLAQVFSCSPKHESGIFHAFSTFESGGPPSHCFSGTMPLADLVAGLNAAEPRVEALQGWPSVIRLLAMEALAGRLTLVPTWVSVAGEVCTPPVREAVRAAWGIELSEFWGCSEGTYAFPCGVGRRDAHRRRPGDLGAGGFAGQRCSVWAGCRPGAADEPVQSGPAADPLRHRGCNDNH